MTGDDVVVLLALFWIAASVAVAIAARSRGRSWLGWFLLAAIVSPLIALTLVLVLPRQGGALVSPFGEAISAKTHARCPACRELVRIDASRCRYCGETLTPRPIEGAPQ